MVLNKDKPFNISEQHEIHIEPSPPISVLFLSSNLRARSGIAPAMMVGVSSPLLILFGRGDCFLAYKLISRPRNAANRAPLCLLSTKITAGTVCMKSAAAIAITTTLALLVCC